MRSSVLFTAAFAAAALAGPVFDKRGEIVVTDNEVVYVTQLVTVTEGQAAPTEVPSAAPTGYTPWWKKGRGRGRKSRTRTGYGTAPAPTQPAPVPTTQAPAPVPSSYEPEPQPEPTTEAPAPAPTSYEQPEPAPTSYEQPAPAPPSSSAAAPAPTGYNPPSTGTSYKDIVVRHHNYHRANHSSPDIAWSEAVAATAQKIAQTCKYGHSMDVDGGEYGQNIAAGQEGSKIASVISDQFYNGEIEAFEGQYGKADPDMSNFAAWGHLTQVVWASTTEVGCYTADCSASGLSGVSDGVPPYFTVCNYKIPGNMGGAYAKNVGQCLGKPTITGKDA